MAHSPRGRCFFRMRWIFFRSICPICLVRPGSFGLEALSWLTILNLQKQKSRARELLTIYCLFLVEMSRVFIYWRDVGHESPWQVFCCLDSSPFHHLRKYVVCSEVSVSRFNCFENEEAFKFDVTQLHCIDDAVDYARPMNTTNLQEKENWIHQ